MREREKNRIKTNRKNTYRDLGREISVELRANASHLVQAVVGINPSPAPVWHNTEACEKVKRLTQVYEPSILLSAAGDQALEDVAVCFALIFFH